MPDSFLISLFEHKAWCNRELIRALRDLPADVDRAQFGIAVMTLEHTSIVDRIFRTRLSGIENSFKAVVGNQIPELDELAATLADTDTWYLNYVKCVNPRELDETVKFQFVADGDAGRMTKAEILAHVIAHGASHRGAIGKMLETLKVRGAPDMVTTWIRQRPEA